MKSPKSPKSSSSPSSSFALEDSGAEETKEALQLLLGSDTEEGAWKAVGMSEVDFTLLVVGAVSIKQ